MIRVLVPGLLTTVQDLGRSGLGAFGVPIGGAADAHALRLGNLLLGNDEGAAALEATLVGPELLFEEAAVVALAGAPFGAQLDGVPLPVWEAVKVPAGGRLAMGRAFSGTRAYVCVRGGLDVPSVLGSRATDVATGFGGLDGRPLRAGDRLSVGTARGEPRGRRVDAAAARWSGPRRRLRVTRGPQGDWFREDVVEAFLSRPFRVSASSSRTGVRLEGKPLAAPTRSLVTEGVVAGAVQVPPAGLPIVLLVEHPSTGGYPKIGSVISADLSALAQLRPGEEVRFARVSFEEARRLFLDREARLGAPGVFLP
ncbi:MAG TPA: biotin-dependent carboxyltransferase family protein [Thermoanaerobaculia bacterium]|nr:biotin-dependent carboxyltransferase family protein [Thermoanaerobaculia bacterium]